MKAPIPLLLRPAILSFKNRWLKRIGDQRLITRDVLFAAVAMVVIYSVYHALCDGLTHFLAHDPNAGQHLVILLNAALSFLFVLLALSSFITALSSLYLSDDIDLIVASPISPGRFFACKLAEIFATSSWVLLLLGLPSVLALLTVFQPGIFATLQIATVLLAFLMIPTVLAVAIVTPACLLFPFAGTRIGAPLAAACFVLLLYLAATFSASSIPRDSLDHLFSTMEIFTKYQGEHSPVSSVAYLVNDLLQNQSSGRSASYLQLTLMLFGGIWLSYISFSRLYFTSLSVTKAKHRTVRFKSLISRELLAYITPFLGAASRAVIRKEFKAFARDPQQILQVFFLLLLCFVYLFHLGRVQLLEERTPAAELIWRLLLVITNIAMGSFLVIAACTRFVYPSISLEGRSFWIIQNAPLTLKQMMYAKFMHWSLPIAVISAVFLSSGAMAVQAEVDLILLTFVSSVIIACGVVGLAIVFGSLFCNLDWEHASQLTANLGSLAFMAGGSILVVIGLIPVSLVAFICEASRTITVVSEGERYVAYAAGTLLLIMINILAIRLGMGFAETSLEGKTRA